MDNKGSSTVSYIRDVEQHHIELGCLVDSSEIHQLISALASHLTPFTPTLLIQQLDKLYYQLVDHCTDQEVMMQQLGFEHYKDHRSIHNQFLDTLANARHRQIFERAEMAAELIGQLEQLVQIHQQQETVFARYRESLRFHR